MLIDFPLMNLNVQAKHSIWHNDVYFPSLMTKCKWIYYGGYVLCWLFFVRYIWKSIEICCKKKTITIFHWKATESVVCKNGMLRCCATESMAKSSKTQQHPNVASNFGLGIGFLFFLSTEMDFVQFQKKSNPRKPYNPFFDRKMGRVHFHSKNWHFQWNCVHFVA